MNSHMNRKDRVIDEAISTGGSGAGPGGYLFNSKSIHPHAAHMQEVGFFAHERHLKTNSSPCTREFIDNLLVRIHCIIVVIRWTGLAPWEFEFTFPR